MALPVIDTNVILQESGYLENSKISSLLKEQEFYAFR
jgi:hypothetical protein